ncbi:MAG TPA: M56 family metallopeptidase [Acidobacteriaceae bacterium]|jgi:beta-lactamase regulating signal transducer with metallopeptidase domain|nr:M56 family metallopeptidase [Acidobacteriaceae bacterium]
MTGFAQLLVAPVLNSLPEGVLLAVGAWLLLRLMGAQNSGTRFAVWLTALAGVVALPVLASLGLGSPALGWHGLAAYGHPEFTVPESWAMAFLIFWIGVGAVALARVAAGVWQVRRLRRDCREVAIDELDPELQEALRPTKRLVRLLVSDTARVPAAIGFLRPAVVLPAWALDELSPEELRPILIHELEHLRRRDDWTNLLQKAVRAILFFHPAVWWIDARLSLERELACDDAVLAATGNPRAYAGCLIDLLERGCARRGWTMAQALVPRARDASMRITRILRSGQPATTRIGRAALGVTAALSMACTVAAVWAPGLVGFAPGFARPTLPVSARLTQPLANNDMRFPTARVVPAAFHPEQRQAVLGKTGVAHRRRPEPRPAEVRNLMASRQEKAPVVMARLNADRKPASDRTAGSLDAPTLLFFTQAESNPKAGPGAGARPAAALTGREAQGMQIQVVQIVEEVREQQGGQVQRVQIIRLVLVVPAQGLTAQSI